jgi:predicted transcriptional regulator
MSREVNTTVIPMNDTTPPLHPIEREQLREEPTLVVTVKSSDEFQDDVTEGIEALDRGESVDSTPTLSFTSYDHLMETLTPRVLDLIEAIRREQPSSINETARVVDRDVKNVHEELSRLARLGIIFFEEDGQRKRPVVWFDELVITLPVDPDASDSTAAAP